MGKLEYSVTSPPAVERYDTTAITPFLNKVWEGRFGDTSQQVRSIKDPIFMPYRTKNLQVMVLLEHINVLQSQTNIHSDHKAEIPAGTAENLLKGKRICVIGGHEGEIYAAMGADVVAIDPHLGSLPPSKFATLQEIPQRITADLASSFANQFDVTISSWVFDQGSGLNPDGRFASTPTEEQPIFSSHLEYILDMTKVGGISVHNGNMMPYAISGINQSRMHLREAIASSFGDTSDTSDTIVILQKL